MKVPIVIAIVVPLLAALLPVGCKSEPAPELACNTATCMVGVNACGKAACMTPPGGGDSVCEFGPKLTGTCRCFFNDKRPCTKSGGGSGLKTCVGTGTNTYWDTCI